MKVTKSWLRSIKLFFALIYYFEQARATDNLGPFASTPAIQRPEDRSKWIHRTEAARAVFHPLILFMVNIFQLYSMPSQKFYNPSKDCWRSGAITSHGPYLYVFIWRKRKLKKHKNVSPFYNYKVCDEASNWVSQ